MPATRLHIAAIATGAFFTAQALPQKYPSRPVRMLVPWTAGSQTDILARIVQPRLADSLGQPIIIDNRPGAGGTVGAAMVAAATADGHTITMQAATHAVSPAPYSKLPRHAP
jgi:tripartite-type tricarboxylate transporter receptor subunit TctC